MNHISDNFNFSEPSCFRAFVAILFFAMNTLNH